jgi:uncharacterized membrane protein YGL010W
MMDFKALIREYDLDHQNGVNQRIHLIAVPIIVFSILGIGNRIRITEETSLGFILWVSASIFYLVTLPERWLKKIGFIFLLFAFLVLSQAFSLKTHVGLFLVGWILQLIGHLRYEKRSPAFTRNILQLLVGPYWVWVKLLRSRAKS